MLITNKYKSAKKGDDKTNATRRARREPLDFSVSSPRLRKAARSKSPRSQPGVCPICIAPLQRIAKKTRYHRSCYVCGGGLKLGLICPHCSTQRVWSGKRGKYCHGCGKAIQAAHLE